MNWTKAMAWFIVLLMVFSILGIVGSSFFSEDEGQKEYNDFSFIRAGSQWLLKVEDKDYYFKYLPNDLENLTSPPWDTLEFSRIYLGFKPKDNITSDKAINSLGYLFYNNKIMLQKACTVEEDCPDIPIMDCKEKQGIVIISGENDSYTQDEKCLIITAADNQELEKLTERLIYKLLNVMS